MAVCPTCSKQLEERHEMRIDEMGTRGAVTYFYCNVCRKEVKL
jgi:uncharacterized protein with PIN domain